MAATAFDENRIACPACGRPIHPIAGRCKHCRVELTNRRAGLVAPGPALVALGGAAPMAPHLGEVTIGARLPEPHTALIAGGSGWSRRWPIAVAGVAIVVIAVSLLVLVVGRTSATPKKLAALGPAPEMMPTQPMAPDSPAPGPNPTAPPTPDDLPSPAAPSPTDPPPTDPWRAAPSPAAPANPRGLDFKGFVGLALDQTCQRLETCGTGAGALAVQCSLARMSLDQVQDYLGSTCTTFNGAAAQQCLASIAALPCPDDAQIDMGQVATLLIRLYGCSTICGATGLGGLVKDLLSDPSLPSP